MTEISRAEKRAMKCLSDWVDAVKPDFNAVEMQALKQRLTAYFREYEDTECFHLGLILGLWGKAGRTMAELRDEHPALWAKIEAIYAQGDG